MDFSQSLLNAADALKQAIEKKIDSGVPPPNAPSTIRRKGHGLTLRDTWSYRNNIEIRMDPDGMGFEVGVFKPEIAEYVIMNEHGTTRIPPRPVFGPVADTEGKEILDRMEEDILNTVILTLGLRGRACRDTG